MQPRGARTEIQADASGPIFVARRCNGLVESILLKAQLREAIVAAIKGAEIGPDPEIAESRYGPDIGLKASRLEIARRKPRALLAQRTQDRFRPRSEAVYDGIPADDEGLHASPLEP
jgi:hypothetical protein